MTTSRGSQHLDDGTLVRILDRQSTADGDTDHFSSCAECRRRYRVIEHRSDTFHGLLAQGQAAEPTPPADLLDRARASVRRRSHPSRSVARSPLLRAAAVAAILCAGALTAEPVREWLGAAARQLVAALPTATRPTPPEATTAPGSPGSDGAVEVTIVPVGDRLVLRFDIAEPGAVARVRFHDHTGASAQVVDDTPAPELGDASAPALVALPDGFRVHNAGARGSGYRFTAPAGMPVEVRVGRRVVATLRGEAGQTGEVTLDHRPRP